MKHQHPAPPRLAVMAFAVVCLCLLSLPVAAETAGGAAGEAGCTPHGVDLTADGLRQLMAEGRVSSVGVPEVRHVARGDDVVKISEGRFEVRDDEGNYIVGGSITCTATCTGSWCAVGGCDPVGGNCSPCSCDGNCISQCTCTKESSAEPAPGPRSPTAPSG